MTISTVSIRKATIFNHWQTYMQVGCFILLPCMVESGEKTCGDPVCLGEEMALKHCTHCRAKFSRVEPRL